MNDFNFIAPVYDRLAFLAFGRSIQEIQQVYLHTIKITDQVLILGGGTGKILQHVPKCKRIDFLEKSHRMIRFAAKKTQRDDIRFICKDFLHHSTASKYNVIICPFFLDCFAESTLKSVLHKCRSLLAHNGALIVTDFLKTGKNEALLRVMHWFFRVFSNLESKGLPNLHKELIDSHYKEMAITYGKFGLFNAIYQAEHRK